MYNGSSLRVDTLPVEFSMEAPVSGTKGLNKHLLNELFYASEHEHLPLLVLVLSLLTG